MEMDSRKVVYKTPIPEERRVSASDFEGSRLKGRKGNPGVYDPERFSKAICKNDQAS